MAIPQLSPYEIPPLPTHQAAHWQLDPKRAALLIHDMQEYFIAAYDRNANPMSTVLSNIQSIISFADSHGMPVFFSAQPPAQHWSRRGLLNDVWGTGIVTDAQAAIIPELEPAAAHHQVITKWRYSAFERTDLEQALAFTRRNQLIITGVYGHMGCQVTAVDAFMKDIQPFMVGDAIADFSATEHAEAMSWVAKRSGMVISTAEVLSA